MIHELRFTAYHEAGHAVAHHRLGFTSIGCNVVPRDDQLGNANSLDGWNDPESARDWATSLAAGYCAAVEAGADEATAYLGGQSDFEYIEETGVKEVDAIARAFAFVRDPKNWKAITGVAEELIARKTLDDAEVDIIIDIADGAMDRTHLERYRALSAPMLHNPPAS